MEKRYMTQAEFAKVLGVTRQQINQYKRKGKLVMSGNKVDYEESIKRLGDTKDTRGGDRGKMSINPKSPMADNQMNLYKARAFKETYSAKREELNYKKEIGELISRTDEEKRAFELAIKLRDRLLGIPDRLAPLVSAEKSEDKNRELLKKEFDLALDDFISLLERK